MIGSICQRRSRLQHWANLYHLVAGHTLRQTVPAMPAWAIPILIVLGVANFIFVIGVWKWKKWGVYGFGVVSLVAFVINLISIGILGAIFGLVGLGILIFLLRNAWAQMD